MDWTPLDTPGGQLPLDMSYFFGEQHVNPAPKPVTEIRSPKPIYIPFATIINQLKEDISFEQRDRVNSQRHPVAKGTVKSQPPQAGA
ncbi:hypothetical protein CSAL01_13690 [Colletotrichum salicis]|uniref:Uncharacterized protein n=1 Tax=Colletotrichum salicis TaxID=1209931 RepID=A0A135SUW3_9PEZI|nr:hypothetical protein CSAL01_13690 [Colletotrichum salicis]